MKIISRNNNFSKENKTFDSSENEFRGKLCDTIDWYFIKNDGKTTDSSKKSILLMIYHLGFPFH